MRAQIFRYFLTLMKQEEVSKTYSFPKSLISKVLLYADYKEQVTEWEKIYSEDSQRRDKKVCLSG